MITLGNVELDERLVDTEGLTLSLLFGANFSIFFVERFGVFTPADIDATCFLVLAIGFTFALTVDLGAAIAERFEAP